MPLPGILHSVIPAIDTSTLASSRTRDVWYPTPVNVRTFHVPRRNLHLKSGLPALHCRIIEVTPSPEELWVPLVTNAWLVLTALQRRADYVLGALTLVLYRCAAMLRDSPEYFVH